LEGTHHEGLKHVESVYRLIHGDHVASVVYSKELEVFVLLKLTGRLTIDKPVLVLSVIELLLAGPGNSISPCLTTSPVANKVFVTRVDKNFKATFKHSLDFCSEISEPVTK